MARFPALPPVPVRDRTGKRINPSHWRFNPNTGEHHLITHRDAQGEIVDNANYQQRYERRVFYQKQARKGLFILVPAVAIFVWAVKYRSVDWGVAGLVMILSGSFCFVGFLLWSDGRGRLASYKYQLGPPPFPPMGQHEVEEQKAHGPGGWLQGDDLDEAARGGGRQAPFPRQRGSREVDD